MDGFLAILSTGQSRVGEVTDTVALAAKSMRSCFGDRARFTIVQTTDIVLVAALADHASDSALQTSTDRSIVYVHGPVVHLGQMDSQPMPLEPDRRTPSDPRVGIVRGAIAAAAGIEQGLRELSGSYHALVYNPQLQRTTIVTDRLASRLVFVASSSGILCVSSDIRCLLELPMVDCSLDLEGFAQLVRTQMIMEERTLYRAIEVLPPGTALTIDHQKELVATRQYWRLAPLAPFGSEEEAIQATAEAFSTATARIVSGRRRPSLLLSGGLDSRMILAALVRSGASPIEAHTFGLEDTGETKLAQDCARIAGAEWALIPQAEEHYWEALPEILELTNGLYSFSHAHTFRPAQWLAAAGYDTVVNGWGIDAFHSGSYLPKGEVRLMGRLLHTYQFRTVSNSRQVHDYLCQKLDMQAGRFERSLLCEKLQPLWAEGCEATLWRMIDRAQALSASPYDWIDAVTLGLSTAKFRSFPVVTGIRACLRERNPLFESDVLEVYQRLPPRWRFLGSVFRRALDRLHPELARVTYFNTGTSPLVPPLVQALSVDAGMLWRSFASHSSDILVHLGLPIRSRHPYGNYPAPEALACYLVSEEPMASRVRELLLHGPVVQSGLVDRDRVRQAIEECGRGGTSTAETLLVLATVALWFDTYPIRVS